MKGRSAVAFVVAAAAITAAFPAWSLPAPGTVLPLFSISKSENKNVVQFAEHLDASCAPASAAPVFAYWRMLEHGPTATEPLLDREQPAYGIASQVVTQRGADSGAVRVMLRALPHAPLLVESRRGADGRCEAAARLPIGGVDARLYNVHAVLRWPFGVARLWVSGWAMADGHVVRDARVP